MAEITKEDVTAAVDQAMVEALGVDSKGKRHHKREAVNEEAYPAAWEADIKHIVAAEGETASRSRTHFDNNQHTFDGLFANLGIAFARIAHNAVSEDHLCTLKSLDVKGAWLDKIIRLDEDTLALRDLYKKETNESIAASVAARAWQILEEKKAAVSS